MRKFIAAALLLGLLITAAGCKAQKKPAATTNSSTLPTTVTVPVDVKPIKQIPMVAVSLPMISENTTAQDNTVVFTNTYQNMQLITSDPEVADKVIVDYLNQTEKFSAAATTQKQAEDAYNQKPSSVSWSPYLSQITYTPTRIDQGVLSLFGNHINYTGGAHGNMVGHSLNYDLLSGKRLSLSEIFTPSVNPAYISALVLNALSTHEGLFPDYKETVNSRFNSNMLQDDDWYLTNSGLCFFFSPYEIASFAAGTISAEIPYSALIGTLKDEYFPAEREQAGGSVQVAPFDEKIAESYSQFAELVLKENAKKILLFSNDGVYDIRLETGSWSADGKTFTPKHTAFASYALTPGDALMVDAAFDEKLPVLRLSYTTGGKTVQYFIQANGSYSLSPA